MGRRRSIIGSLPGSPDDEKRRPPQPAPPPADQPKRKPTSLIGALPSAPSDRRTPPAAAESTAPAPPPPPAAAGKSLIGALPTRREPGPIPVQQPPSPPPPAIAPTSAQPKPPPSDTSLIGALPARQEAAIAPPPQPAPPLAEEPPRSRPKVSTSTATIPMPADALNPPDQLQTPARDADSIIGALPEQEVTAPVATEGLPTQKGRLARQADETRGFRLVVRRQAASRTERRVHSFTFRQDISIGPEDSELPLPGVSRITLGVAPSKVSITQLDQLHETRLNDQPLQRLPVLLKNGDLIASGDYMIRVAIQMQQIDGQHRSHSLVSRFTTALVAFVLIWQFAMIAGLGWMIYSRVNWGHQIARARVAQQVDDLKHSIKKIAPSPEDPRQQMLLEAIGSELKHMTVYLRQHRSDLTDRQVQDLVTDLQDFKALLAGLGDGDVFGSSPSIGARPYLEGLLRHE